MTLHTSQPIRPSAVARLAGSAADGAVLTDREAAISAVNEIGLSADLREWESVRSQFTDRVFADYSSLTGTAGAEIAADDLVASWKAFLPGFTSTQHVITGHRLNIHGDRAQVTSQFIATHRLAGAAGGELWTLGGRYVHSLVRTPKGWKVSAMTMSWAWQTGNTELPKLAGSAAAAAANAQ